MVWYDVELREWSGRLFAGLVAFDLEIGSNLFEAPDFSDLVGTEDRRWVLGLRSGLVVLDGETFTELYERIEYPGGAELLLLPSQVFTGSAEALAGARLLIDGGPEPLLSLAPHLYDPRRVRAGIAGVPVRTPRLP
jgi:hypothetical protein